MACRSVVGASRKKAVVLRSAYEIVGESFPHPNGLFHSARTPRPCGLYRLHDRRHRWRRALLVTVAFRYSLLGFDPSAHTQVYLFHLHVHALAWSCWLRDSSGGSVASRQPSRRECCSRSARRHRHMDGFRSVFLARFHLIECAASFHAVEEL